MFEYQLASWFVTLLFLCVPGALGGVLAVFRHIDTREILQGLDSNIKYGKNVAVAIGIGAIEFPALDQSVVRHAWSLALTQDRIAALPIILSASLVASALSRSIL